MLMALLDRNTRNYSYFAFYLSLTMNNTFCAGVTGIWLSVPTRSLRFTTTALISNVALLTRATPK